MKLMHQRYLLQNMGTFYRPTNLKNKTKKNICPHFLALELSGGRSLYSPSAKDSVPRGCLLHVWSHYLVSVDGHGKLSGLGRVEVALPVISFLSNVLGVSFAVFEVPLLIWPVLKTNV